MKKYSVIVIVALVCLAFAIPAGAKVWVGGVLVSEAYYLSRDKDYMNFAYTTNLEESQTRLSMFQVYGTAMKVNYRNDDRTIGANVSANLVGENNFTPNSAHLKEGLMTRAAYIWWQVNPKLKLTFGHQNSLFSQQLASRQYSGYDVTAHVQGDGFGNLGQNRDVGIKLEYKLAKKSSIAVAAWYPYLDEGGGFFAQNNPWNAWDEEPLLPKIEAELKTKFGKRLNFMPSVSYYRVRYDGDANSPAGTVGADDGITCWGIALPFSRRFGKLYIDTEFNFSQNPGDADLGGTVAIEKVIDSATSLGLNDLANPRGVSKGVPAAEWDNSTGVYKVYNADYTGWWIQGTYRKSELQSTWVTLL